jgi:hypothetical protein
MRGRGCWNCTHFGNGALAEKLWAMKRRNDVSIIAERLGTSPLLVGDDHQALRLIRDVDVGVANGKLGVCMRGRVAADLVDFRYLCSGWDARQGASVAASSVGGKLDKLPDELRDIADSRAKAPLK